MSTRSRIGIKNDNGTITSIYCHSDGYLGGVGAILADYYPEEEDVRALHLLQRRGLAGSTARTTSGARGSTFRRRGGIEKHIRLPKILLRAAS